MSTLADDLRASPYHLTVVVLSVDDFYLSHQEQTELAARNRTNPLIQHRGQPSTHDMELATSVLSDLVHARPTKLPSYDKGAFDGLGDRIPSAQWPEVNMAGEEVVQIVILEGWCVGFKALERDRLMHRWSAAVTERKTGEYEGRLGWNAFEDIDFVNHALGDYQRLTERFDALIHIDAEETRYVYEWRLEQERALRKARGTGMTDRQVKAFVDGYYPAYELYTDGLRGGIFDAKGNQLRLVLGSQRELKDIYRI